MKIEINKVAREEAIDLAVQKCISQIKENATKGISVTECYVGQDIAIDTFRRVEKLIDNVNTISQIGPVGYQSSIAVGDSRMAKFRLS